MKETFEIGGPATKPESLSPLYWIIPLSLALLAYIITPNFLRARARGSTTSCKSNCKNIATALEMYASEHKGLYPGQLADLIPGRYLKQIPTCPAAGKDTYSISYQSSPDAKAFTFACTGNNHARSYAGFDGPSDNYPQYGSWTGLVDHP